MASNITPTGKELFFSDDEIIVSKTNLKGHIIYANRVFIRLAGYKEKEIIGAPHSLIRHPDMPRCIFKLLWDTIQSGEEIFAYVVNMANNGDHYWVLAHVTPSFDDNGTVNGYHSNRRVSNRDILDGAIRPLYKSLLEKEASHSNRKEGMQASFDMLLGILKEKDIAYDEFIFSALAA